MGQHKVAKAIKEKHVIKFQKFDSPKSQKLTLIINGLRSLPRPYGMVLNNFKKYGVVDNDGEISIPYILAKKYNRSTWGIISFTYAIIYVAFLAGFFSGSVYSGFFSGSVYSHY